MATVNGIQFGSMPDEELMVFILRLQQEYPNKVKVVYVP